jgi:hypothetical protein
MGRRPVQRRRKVLLIRLEAAAVAAVADTATATATLTWQIGAETLRFRRQQRRE